ncbi:MAG: DUF835 domain-containing protein [Candidatus Thermoplasmatota archaeon]
MGEEEKIRETTFFVMPGNALKSLRDELQISAGEEMSEGILFRYGFRCGEGMIQRMSLRCTTMKEITELFPSLWAGVGLGKIKIEEVSEEGALVIFEESVEARHRGQSKKPSCDFTKGYIAGIASALSDKQYTCIEEACISAGDRYCHHRLMPGIGEIKPTAEAESTTRGKYKMERGVSYLIKEETPELSYEIFVDAVMHGGQGLCITRDYPDKIRKKYNLAKTPILWLSNAESEYAIEPVQLGKLYHKIEDFLKKSQNSVIFLSGIEYIITQNNYTSALKFLQLVRDQIAIYDSLLIAPISPPTLPERDLKMIEKEMTVYTDVRK